ncbi:hypothetical protein C5473_07080 [Leptospira interrogans serovar Weerasinghe]|nr:hypothetical protein C5473_07080 [Leptospira interrogans serovar Weerasinghe]
MIEVIFNFLSDRVKILFLFFNFDLSNIKIFISPDKNSDLVSVLLTNYSINIQNLFQNLKMWELTQKFNNIRITEGSQITKSGGFCRNYCVLLKISKKLLSKFFKVFGQVLNIKLEVIFKFKDKNFKINICVQ